MPYCTACGTEVRAAQNYCTACGSPVGRRGGDASDARGTSADRAADGTDARGGAAGRPERDDGTTAGTDRSSRATEDPIAETREDEEEGEEERTSATAYETRGRQLSAAGTGLAGVGAFLPWVEVEILSRSATATGIDGDGRFTLAFAVIAGAVLLLGRGSPWTRRGRGWVLVFGALTALVALFYLNDPLAGAEGVGSVTRDAVRRRSGLYLTALGGGLIALGPLYGSIGPGE